MALALRRSGILKWEDEMKEALIDAFWNFVRVKMENGLTLDEALDQTIGEQVLLWEDCKKAVVGRFSDGEIGEI